MTDIYTIERRTGWQTIVKRVYNSFYDRNFDVGGYMDNFFSYMNSSISTWVHRNGAMDLYEYFEDINIDLKAVERGNTLDDFHCLLFIQSCVAFIYFALYKRKQNRNDSLSEFLLLELESIAHYLDINNYSIEYDEERQQALICKRDVNVDSAIQSINSKEVKLLLLNYIDFRTADDLETKQSIIAKLYKYTEDPANKNLWNYRVLQKDSKEINPVSVFRDINQKFDIRHFQKDIQKANGFVITNKNELNELCDIAFYMFIEAIRIPQIIDYDSKYAQYKAKYLPGQ